MPKAAPPVPLDRIAASILIMRGRKVLLDSELASLYGTTTKRLNEQVKRNPSRFPIDFMFRLTREEAEELNRSQIATGSQKHRDPRFPPFAFTEHGALMAANVLNSLNAVEVSVYVVRAFMRLRETLSQHKDLVAKLDELERKTEALSFKHDALAASTRLHLRQVFDAIRELMSPPVRSRSRPIGFVVDDEKS
jgi:ORF6N domain